MLFSVSLHVTLRSSYSQALHFLVDDNFKNTDTAISLDVLETGDVLKEMKHSRLQRMSTYTTSDFLLYRVVNNSITCCFCH